MERLRLKFSRGEELKFISHLDMSRLWQRAFQRAEIPLAYSQGFNPHPRIAFAAPLPVGATSQAELMDIECYRSIPVPYFMTLMKKELPKGIELLSAYQVALLLPSLQSQVSFAEYQVAMDSEKSREEVEQNIAYLLSLKELPWHHERDTGTRHYDLRALVSKLWLIDCQEGLVTLGMRLRCDETGSGRPEQVALALGFTGSPRLIHRTELILKKLELHKNLKRY
ncbi:MAG: TIGR03936 family radical SAM-associated protein [Chloroflexota bacterium]